MVTPRATQEVSQQEMEIFAKFCEDRNIPTDGPVGEQNVLAIGNYIIDSWKVLISGETLEVALQKLSGHITYFTPAQAKYRQIAAQEPERAAQLNNWIQSPANKTLAKDNTTNDLVNQTALLAELRGRDITAENIYAAIGRLGNRGLLHYAPVERKPDPRQHASDGQGFMPKSESKTHTGGKLNHARVETVQRETPKDTRQDTPDAWQTLAENLRGATHSETEALKSINGNSSRETYILRKRYLARREGSVFNKTAV